jgi:hypothetical protein
VIHDFGLGFSPYGGTYGTRCDSCSIGHLTTEFELNGGLVSVFQMGP